MQQEPVFLFTLIRLAIGTVEATDKECVALLNLSMRQWQDVMSISETQGVAAVVFDGVQKLYEVHKRAIRAAKESPMEWMQWVLKCTGLMAKYEQRNKQQKEVINKLSEIWDGEGVRMMVFKGQTNASFYPVPRHRSVGDIDCYLFGEAEKGDSIMEKYGAVVDKSWYRHSKIIFKGETIENHRVLCHTRGSKKKKRMEKELEALLNLTSMKTIEGCGLALLPSAQFNAHFLVYHALHHFTSEGLRMKQILDWAVFLQSQQEQVDWLVFNDFCKQYQIERFAAVLSYIASECIGINYQDITTDGTFAERVVRSTIYDDDYLFNSGKRDWHVRWLLVKNMLTRDRWKYRDIAQENVWKHLWQNASGYLFDKS